MSVNTSTNDKSYVNVYMFAPYRVVPLLVLIGLFIGAICLVGGWRGFHSVLRDNIYLDHGIIYFCSITFHGCI